MNVLFDRGQHKWTYYPLRLKSALRGSECLGAFSSRGRPVEAWVSSPTEVGINELAVLSNRSRHFEALNAWVPSATEVSPLKLGCPLRSRSAQMDLLPSSIEVGTSELCLVKYFEVDVYQMKAQMGSFYLGGMHTSTILRPCGSLTWKECTLP